MGTISYSTYGLSSVNYNSVQFTASRRASHGLFYSVAYTFSKGLGSTSPDAYHTGQPIVNEFGQSVTLPSARQFTYGPTAQDRVAGSRGELFLPASEDKPRLRLFGP